MARRGRKRQLGTEDEYWRLILGGVGTVDACRRVGITRKTGYRWRAERGGLPPVRVAEAVRGRRYLSRFERQRIATLSAHGLAVREIGRRLERSPSTVSRELRRNRSPHDGGIHDSDLAHARARERASRRRSPRLPLTMSCAPSCRTSSTSSGARSRSAPGCAVSTLSGDGGAMSDQSGWSDEVNGSLIRAPAASAKGRPVRNFLVNCLLKPPLAGLYTAW